MGKKLISLILVLALCLSLGASAFAGYEPDVEDTEAGDATEDEGEPADEEETVGGEEKDDIAEGGIVTYADYTVSQDMGSNGPNGSTDIDVSAYIGDGSIVSVTISGSEVEYTFDGTNVTVANNAGLFPNGGTVVITFSSGDTLSVTVVADSNQSSDAGSGGGSSSGGGTAASSGVDAMYVLEDGSVQIGVLGLISVDTVTIDGTEVSPASTGTYGDAGPSQVYYVIIDADTAASLGLTDGSTHTVVFVGSSPTAGDGTEVSGEVTAEAGEGYSAGDDTEDDDDIYVIASGDCSSTRSYVTWVLTSDGVLTITGEGNMGSGSWWSSYSSSIKSVVIESGVTSIGSDAFEYCSRLTSVNIPDSVTSIGDSAFRGCTGLTSVNIPDNVTYIGSYAFYGCTGLTYIDIPDSVTSIEGSTFQGCTGLTSIDIPGSVTSIGSSAFYNCTVLETLTIGEGVTTIGSDAFNKCTSLVTVTIGSSVTTIGDGAFWGCASLTDVYYSGTEEDWTAISIGSDNDELLNATIHCLGIASEDDQDEPDNDNSDGSDSDEPGSSDDASLTITISPDGTITINITGMVQIDQLIINGNVLVLGVDYTAEPITDDSEDDTWAITVFSAAAADLLDDDTLEISVTGVDADGETVNTSEIVTDTSDNSNSDSTSAPDTDSTDAGTTSAPDTGGSDTGSSSGAADTPSTSGDEEDTGSSTAAEPDDTPIYAGCEDTGTVDDGTEVNIRSSESSMSSAQTDALDDLQLEAGNVVFVLEVDAYDPETGALLDVNSPVTVVFTIENADLLGSVLCWNENTGRWDEAKFTVDGDQVTVTFPHLCTVVFSVKEAESHTPGDINYDGTVNISDVQTLLKYVNGQSVSVNEYALDVNGDGTVNISDVQTLLKSVNGQGVTIY